MRWTQRCLSAASVAVYKRANLLPLIKRIHPDMFATHVPAVRAANLACVQSMLELWDALGEMESQALLQPSVQIRRPLKPRYDLECFVKADPGPSTPSPSPSSPLRRVSFRLNTPECLTRLQSLPLPSAGQSLKAMQRQLSDFFAAAGLVAAPVEARGTQGQEEGEEGHEGDGWGPAAAHSPASLDAVLFDRAVQRPLSPFSPSSSSSSRARRERQRDEVDAWMGGGNVLVRGLGAEEEFQAMDRLRAFLLDYGGVINFSAAGWKAVVLVLGAEGAGKAGEGKERKESKEGTGKERKEGREGRCYPVRELQGAYVVEVPAAFKAGRLLETVRTGLGRVTSLF